MAGSWTLGGTDVPERLSGLVGQITVRWGFLEQQFDALLSVSVGSKGIGRAIRKMVRGSRTRQLLLTEIAKEALSEEHREKVQPIVSRFTALAKERNVYAHGVWGVHSAYPEQAMIARDDAIIDTQHHDHTITIDAMRGRIFKDMVLVSERDLNRFLKEMDGLTGDTMGAFYAIQGDQLKARFGIS
jgi:hypothetical protein